MVKSNEYILHKICILLCLITQSSCSTNTTSNVNSHLPSVISQEPLKEFQFFSIRSRILFGGLGGGAGPIGEVTSFYLTNSNHFYDFEIEKKDIEDHFINNKVFLKKMTDQEILICTTPSQEECYKTGGSLVQKFIVDNGL